MHRKKIRKTLHWPGVFVSFFLEGKVDVKASGEEGSSHLALESARQQEQVEEAELEEQEEEFTL